MYLEWHLPSGAGGMAAGMTRGSIQRQLSELAKKHGFSYRTVTNRYQFYCEITPETAYSMLVLEWNPLNSFQEFTVRQGKMPERK